VKIIVNGKETEIGDDQHVGDLIRLLGLKPERLALELNRRILRRADWASTRFAEGDRIEIVHFVGGGA
jgi:thiamine biosynthesis protein ThiS